MANVTLSIDDEMLKLCREYAKKHGLSLNALIRRLLQRTVTRSGAEWLEECFQAMDDAGGDSSGRRWTRDELYQR